MTSFRPKDLSTICGFPYSWGHPKLAGVFFSFGKSIYQWIIFGIPPWPPFIISRKLAHLQHVFPAGVKHGWLENPRYNWRFSFKIGQSLISMVHFPASDVWWHRHVSPVKSHEEPPFSYGFSYGFLRIHHEIQRIFSWLVVSTPLKNMNVNWDDEIPKIW